MPRTVDTGRHLFVVPESECVVLEGEAEKQGEAKKAGHAKI
jgi:hypothetical protein